MDVLGYLQQLGDEQQPTKMDGLLIVHDWMPKIR
jgi:hypothetical protein